LQPPHAIGCVRCADEKIGKTHPTYAQGASAELVAAITIGASLRGKLKRDELFDSGSIKAARFAGGVRSALSAAH
jgi:hypothetical protein